MSGPARSPLLFHRWRFPNARAERQGEGAGGATTTQAGEKLHPTEGYGIGTHEGTVARTKVRNTPHRLAREKRAQVRLGRHMAREHPTQGYLVGAWRDNGQLYYDPTTVFNGTEQEARELGRKHKQQAIYDFKNKRVIFLG